jgi:hypothetical protein
MGDARTKSAFTTAACLSESILGGGMQTVLIYDLDRLDYPLTPGLVILMVGNCAMPESTFALRFNRNQVITHDTNTIFKF